MTTARVDRIHADPPGPSSLESTPVTASTAPFVAE